MTNEDNIDKLTILYLMDRMEVSLLDDTITDICSTDNDWMPYLSCKNALHTLADASFIHISRPNGKNVYTITPEGRLCVASFYTRIPISRREQIADFVKKKKIEYRKRQELNCDYYLNKDGTYTVQLVIADPSSSTNMLEIKISADSKNSAKFACKHWEDKAADIYETLYEHLFD